MVMLRQSLIRLRALFRRDEIEADFDEEVRYHLDREVERLLARGLSPKEARAMARRGFGSPVSAKDEARETWRWRWIDELAQDLQYAVRQLSSNRGFAAATVLTLALGIGATTMLFSVRRSYAANERTLASPERLVYVGQGPKPCQSCTDIALGNYVTIRDRTRSLEHLSLFADWEPVLRGSDVAELIDGAQVTTGFFRTLDIRPMLGRTLIPSDSASGLRHVVVLSEALWAARFGADSGILGRTIVLNRIPHVVVGVVPNEAVYPPGTRLWVPLVPTLAQANDRTAAQYRVVGRLRAGVSVEAAAAEIGDLAGQISAEFPETMGESSLKLAPLLQFQSNQRTGDGGELIFTAAVGLLLLIACINLASLLIARLMARRRELAVRGALGAAPSRIARQLMAETILLTALAGAAGLVLAAWGTRTVIGGAFSLDVRTFGVALATGVLTGLVIGLWPSVRFARSPLVDELRQGTRLATGDLGTTRARRALVVAQVAIGVVLLAAAGALARSFQNIYDVEPGFSTERLLTVRVWNALPGRAETADPKRFDRLVEAIEAIPSVERAGATLGLPFGHGARRGRFEIDGQPVHDPEQRPSVHMQAVTHGYFGALGVPMLQGRPFSDADGVNGPRVAIINRAFARRFFPDGEPIGRRLLIDGERWEIVGVAADIFHGDVEQIARPEIYRPMQQWSPATAWIAIRTRADPGQLVPAVVAAVGRLDPDIAITRSITMNALRASDMSSERRMLRLIGAFAVAAVLISAIGLYGLISYSVAQRAREFGIRIALGAQRSTVRRMVLAQGLRLSAIGVAIGLLGALAGLRVMRGMLFDVSPVDPFTLAGVIGLVSMVALIAAYLPARRATLVDPMRSLHEE